METLSSLATAFGIGRDGSADGRRRLVGLLAFISFALVIAATVAPKWVAGGIDFPVDNAEVSATAHFRVDLTQVVIEFQQPGDAYSPGGITAYVTYPRTTWMARQIAAATTPNCVRGSPDVVPGDNNYWCGIAIENFNRDIDAVYGLWVFSSVLITVAWLMSWSLMASAPVFENPLSFKVLAGLLSSAAFFSTIGLIVFAASKISSTFCTVFEGPVNEGNDTVLNYCGYHDGFGIAVAAAVMTGISALIMVFYMPWTPPSASASAPAYSVAARTDANYNKIEGAGGVAVAPAGFNSA